MRTTTIHSSGRFDRSVASLGTSVDRLHTQGSLITHTEMSRNDRDQAFVNVNWSFAHLDGRGDEDECVVEWDNDIFVLQGEARSEEITELTFMRSKEYGGKEAPPTRALIVPLAFARNPKKRLTVITAHMSLDNTDRRAEVWIDSCAGLERVVREVRRADPTTKILMPADWNKNFRQADERLMLSQHVAKPMRLTAAWHGHVPDIGGTHGPLALIDGTYTDAEVLDAWLLPDDPSSDHRPYAVDIRL